MKVLHVRNCHEALPRALRLLQSEGISRDSRNGPVLQAPTPVVTVYSHPLEKVIFWPERDANPFFHLYEALYMLAGRNDVAGPARYSKNIGNYSDDNQTFHGAYGHRWRRAFGFDQLKLIAARLRQNPEDRRCVLQMWDAKLDLNPTDAQKDLPCNDTATFQRDASGALHLVVFCRSNDIIWGAYGANAVHFAFLLEYMAAWIGCPVGTYSQVSVNWHGYVETIKTNGQVPGPDVANYVANPYTEGTVKTLPLAADGDIGRIDELITTLLEDADTGFSSGGDGPLDAPCFLSFYYVLKAHWAWASLKGHGEERFLRAFEILAEADQTVDWVVAATLWIQRRYDKWKNRTLFEQGIGGPGLD